MPPYALPSVEDVRQAALFISPMIHRTSIKSSSRLTEMANQSFHGSKIISSEYPIELYFKCENLQYTGSFKFRGACHFLLKLDNLELANGVVAYSTGNHAQAVAHAAQLTSQKHNFTIPTTVVVPSKCPQKKISAAKSHGATVLLAGTDPNTRVLLAEQIQRTMGAVLVPTDHVNVILGQATAVQEFLEQTTEIGKSLDAVIVPSGTGGLLCGAIAVCKPHGIPVFGAEPECGGPGLAQALQSGRRTTEVHGPPSIADGLRALTGEANWEHIRQEGNVQQVFTVSETHIREALKIGVEELGFVEPSAAVPLAVVLFSHAFHEFVASAKRRMRIGVVLTGGNVSVEDLEAMLCEPSEASTD